MRLCFNKLLTSAPNIHKIVLETTKKGREENFPTLYHSTKKNLIKNQKKPINHKNKGKKLLIPEYSLTKREKVAKCKKSQQ
jgi:hypothetical protein